MSGRQIVFTAVTSVLALLATSVAFAQRCDRDCLRRKTDQYLDALTRHVWTQGGIALNAKATENATEIKIGEGLWKTASRIGTYRIYVQDVQAQEAAFTGVVYEGEKATMMVLRLKVADGKIREIETIVTRYGFPGAAGLAPTKISRARSAFGEVLPKTQRHSRPELQRIANSYYDAIEAGSSRLVPFARDCQRIENGIAVNNNPEFDFEVISQDKRALPSFGAMNCAEQIDAGLWNTDTISQRRFPVIDPEHGLILVFASYNAFAKGPCARSVRYGKICPAKPTPPVSLDVAELFHITGGQIHEIESAWTALPYRTAMGW